MLQRKLFNFKYAIDQDVKIANENGYQWLKTRATGGICTSKNIMLQPASIVSKLTLEK